MSTLTGNQIRNTYDSLLKLEDNDGLNANKKKVTDGLGNETPLSISETEVVSSVNVEASGFKTPTGTSSQVLLADGSTTTLDVGSTQEIFKNVAVSGQSTIVADSNNDTLTFVEGSNVTITTDDATDSITIASSYVDTTYTDGAGLDLVGTEFSHSDTSSVTNLTATSRTYVDGLTFDDYGHVTGYTTATETVVDNDTTYTDGAGLDLTGTVFSHEDTSSVADLTPSARTYVDGITFDDYGHVQSISTSSETLTGTVDGTGTANYVAKWSDADTITDSVIYDDGSNVGIGTNSPASKLNINGGTGSLSTGLTFGDGDTGIWESADDILRFSTAASTRMVINSSGNVGIGTTSIANPLSVYHATLNKIAVFSSGDNGGLIQISDNDTTSYVGSEGSLTYIGQTASASSSNLIIDSSGNVGIGTTSPTSRLQVQAAAGQATTLANSVANSALRINADSVAGSNNIRIGESGSGSYFLQVSNGAGTTPYAINLNPFGGNVGIGTTSPSEALTVSGNIQIENNDGYLQFKDSNAGADNKIRRIYNSEQNLFISRRNDDGTLESNDVTVTSAGDVGIGETSPTQKLHVSGNARITGAYYDSNNSAGASGQVLSSTATGTDWVSLSEIAGVDGTGTANTLAMWSDADTITDAPITVSGDNATFAGDITVTGGDVTLGGTGRIQGVDTVTDNTDATNKLYVDNAITTATGDYLPLAGGTMTGHLKLNDNVQLQVGSSADLQILHDASDSFLINNTGDLYLRNLADDKDIIFQSDDGSGGVENYIQIDGSAGRTLFNKNIRVNDNVQVQVGNSADLQIYHDGTNSVINNLTGHLQIYNQSDDKDIEFISDNGSGGTAVYFKLDGSLVNGTTTLGAVNFPDKSKLFFGTSSDLRIYHDGSDSYIEDAGTGDLRVLTNRFVLNNAADTENLIIAEQNSSVELFYDNSKKFETTSTGIEVTGEGVFTSNVGIGVSPSQPLDVNGTALIRNTIYVGDDIQHWGDGGTGMYFGTDTISLKNDGGSTRLFVESGGNVGIGETNPIAALHINKSGVPQILLDGGSDTTGDIVVPTGETLQIGHWAPSTSTYTDRLRIAADGKVGIGETNPSEELHISSSNPGVRLQDSDGTNTFGRVHFTGSTLQYYSRNNTSNGIHAWYGSDGTANTEFMRLQNDGQLRINEYGSGIFTGTATQRLGVDSNGNVIEIPIGSGAVDGSGTANTLAMWSDADTIADAPITVSGNDATFTGDLTVSGGDITLSGTGRIQGIDTVTDNTDATNKLYVDNAITTATGDYLPLAGGTMTGDLYLDDGSGATPSLYFKNGADNFWRYLMESGGDFSVKEGTSTRLTFQAGGNVGIGAPSPAETLTVSGDSNITGKLAVGSAAAHGIYDFYNQNTAYFNGAVTVDDTLDLVNLKVSGSQGTNGQVLTSTGTGVAWVDATSGDITGVEAGDGLTGGGNSGDVTIDINYSGTDNAILAATDASGSDIGTDAKIWYSADGSIAYANVSDLPFGAGDIDGSGVAGAMTKWTDNDTIEHSDFITESTNGVQFGTDALTYLHTNKRVGIGTNAPSVAFDCAGAAKFQSSFYDGANNLAGSGQVLTGTAVGECLWADANSIAFRDVVTYVESIKIGTSGTFYMNAYESGTQGSISSFTTIVTPYDGEPTKFIIRSTIAQTGFTLSLVDNGGTNIYTSGSINLSANTNYVLTPSSGSWTAGERIAVKITRPTASNNGEVQVTAVYTYDI